jgi:hypothetical protein
VNAFVADRSKKLISSRSGKDLGVHMRARAVAGKDSFLAPPTRREISQRDERATNF